MWLILFMWLGQAADMTVTVAALSHPCQCVREANPLLPDSRVGIVVVKVGITGGIHTQLRKLSKRDKRIVTIGVGLLGAVPAIINWQRWQQFHKR